MPGCVLVLATVFINAGFWQFRRVGSWTIFLDYLVVSTTAPRMVTVPILVKRGDRVVNGRSVPPGVVCVPVEQAEPFVEVRSPKRMGEKYVHATKVR